MTLTTNGCSGDDFVQTGNSLIFTAASTQYLTATGKTNINQQKFTFATWWKRATTGNQYLWAASDGTTSNRVIVLFNSSNALQVTGDTASSGVLVLATTATYTDTTSWHHLCVAVDTTQATAANRVIMYVDGTLISSFGTSTYPSQNTNLANNYASPYYIGADNSPLGTYLNGKLAQYYYIDGQQLTPSSFITGTPGVPKTYSGTYAGTFDFFLPFSNGTSTTTLGADSSGESNNWTLNNMTIANQSTDYP